MRKREELTDAEIVDAELLRTTWNHLKRAQKLSQKALASQWGVHPSAISQYINGHTPLNTEAKLRFAKYLRRPAVEIWPNFQFTESATLTLPAAAQEAAQIVADLDEDKRDAVLNLLRSMRPARPNA